MQAKYKIKAFQLLNPGNYQRRFLVVFNNKTIGVQYSLDVVGGNTTTSRLTLDNSTFRNIDGGGSQTLNIDEREKLMEDLNHWLQSQGKPMIPFQNREQAVAVVVPPAQPITKPVTKKTADSSLENEYVKIVTVSAEGILSLMRKSDKVEFKIGDVTNKGTIKSFKKHAFKAGYAIINTKDEVKSITSPELKLKQSTVKEKKPNLKIYADCETKILSILDKSFSIVFETNKSEVLDLKFKDLEFDKLDFEELSEELEKVKISASYSKIKEYETKDKTIKNFIEDLSL
jgi:hypothetical protein